MQRELAIAAAHDRVGVDGSTADVTFLPGKGLRAQGPAQPMGAPVRAAVAAGLDAARLGRTVHRRVPGRPVAAPAGAAAQDRAGAVRPGVRSPLSCRSCGVRWPSREEAIRRVEGASGVQHRPASSYEDTLTLGAEDARTAALWRVHRARLAEMLQKLRVGRPAPRTDRLDPFALARSAPAQRIRAHHHRRRQRRRPAVVGIPLRPAGQGRRGPPRCLDHAAGLYRQAARHAGRRRPVTTAAPARRLPTARPAPSRCRTRAC